MKKTQSGFSLLEVLITLIVVALGLLGVAGMQVTAIKLADASDVRSRGAVFINDIAERMRSNRTGDYVTSLGAPPVASDLATGDLNSWKTDLAAKLPLGDAQIARATDTECTKIVGVLSPCVMYVITIQWDESRARRSASGADPGLVKFTTTVRI
jgi:type IV pilus assembly protein PilV